MSDMREVYEEVNKHEKHIQTRKQLQQIPDILTFNDLLNRSTLSNEDKQILSLHYLDDKDFRYVADLLGYSESTIKKRHAKALEKLNHMF